MMLDPLERRLWKEMRPRSISCVVILYTMFWIRKTTTDPTPGDYYIERVYSPFVSNTILRCNNIEHLLVCTFAALELPYVNKQLGTKIGFIEHQYRDRFRKLMDDPNIDEMVACLSEVNSYFKWAKHAHLELPEELGNNQDAMRPDFDWDAVDLKIVDVSTYERITITAALRKSIPAFLASVHQGLIPVKLAAEAWRVEHDRQKGIAHPA